MSLVKNFFLFIIYFFTWLSAKQVFCDSKLADLSTISMFFLPHLAWESQPDQTHLVLATAFAAATLFAWLKALRSQQCRWFLAFGLASDDVEIGANAAIDRAALGSTVIGKGTKIDNLVHVAHNVVMGNHCLVMGQVGFAGSTRLGDYCVIASQSGIAGHLKLGRQATVGAKSGVMRDVPDGGTVLGIPAMPDKQTKRQWISLQQLPDMIHRLRALEKELEAVKRALPT